MARLIIQTDEGEEFLSTSVQGVDPKLLAATVMTAIAKMPAPRKQRSDAGKPRLPDKANLEVLPPAASLEHSQVIA